MKKVMSFTIYLIVLLAALNQSAWADDDVLRRMIAPEYDRLNVIANQRGKVRVIVNHRLDTFLPGDLRTNFQRLRASRDRLLLLMAQYNIQPLNEFKNFSGAVYSLSRSELDDLIDSGEVSQVFEDKLNWPSLVQSRALINADTIHDYGLKGNGAIVAIIDTGIEGTHSAFAGRMVTEACFSTNYSAYNSTNLCPGGSSAPNRQIVKKGLGSAALDKCTDVNCNHGTHVASIAAGSDGTVTGVAPEAGIIAIQVFSRFSSDTECGAGKAPCIASYDSDVQSALEYVADLVDGTVNSYNVAAVNMSFSGQLYTSICDGNATYTTALNALNALNVAPVAASGNNSKHDRISTPACVASVIAVGSVSDTTDLVSSWSNTRANLLDILAPGQPITAALPGGGYGSMSGTSMATPHVAGAMAILKATNSNYTVSDMLSILTTNSIPVTDTRPTPDQVHPRLDLGLVTQFLADPADFPQISIATPSNGSVINVDQGAIALTASASDLQDGDLSSSVTWNSDLDGVISSPAALTLGTHTLTATVVDSTGFSTEDSVTVLVVNPPSVAINSPESNSEYLEGLGFILSGSASDIEDGDLSASIQWVSDFDGLLGSGASINVNPSAGIHQITATVTDSDGASPTILSSIQITIIADSDSDGMADDWEAFYGINDPVADADNDGLSNLVEFEDGSNPIDAAPTVVIIAPANGAEYVESSIITLTGVATDNEDGNLDAGISWSSDKDGALGAGGSINISLSLGIHTITATVTDSQGASVVIPATLFLDIGIVADINNDGIISFADLALIEGIVVDSTAFSAGSIIRADVTEDGIISVADWLLLQKTVLGNN